MGDIFGVHIPLVPQSILDALAAKLLAIFKPIISPVRALVNIFTKFQDSTVGLFRDAENLVVSIKAEYQAIKGLNFGGSGTKAGKSRVMLPGTSFEQIKRLITEIPGEVVDAVRDLITQVRSKLGSVTEAEEAAGELAELEDLQSLKRIFSKLGEKFGKIFEKTLGVLVLILDALDTVHATIIDLQKIVDDIREAREDLQNLSGILLPQNKPRKRVYLADGKVLNRRVGHFFKQ